MKPFTFQTHTRQLLADMVTPVSIYLKIRDLFPNSLLLESSDYHSHKNSSSFICLEPMASFMVENGEIAVQAPDGTVEKRDVATTPVADALEQFVKSFISIHEAQVPVNGLFGYMTYDAVRYFESISLDTYKSDARRIPDVRYAFYRFIICVNHFHNQLTIIENCPEGEASRLNDVVTLMANRNFAEYSFKTVGEERSNLTGQQFVELVKKGKEHCFRGDVFQIVLSRRFEQSFQGDEFNVYRALRSVNPSPYLFFFDYGSYKILGSSPEAQIVVEKGVAAIHPIAGTFRRTGNDEADRQLAERLTQDEKENAEHVMLVDLARNDLSRNSDRVQVEVFREVQYYSHVIHLVSKVTGVLRNETNLFRLVGESFPAGTLSGAPKYKAMQLINQYEADNRGFYGGCIGYIGFNGNFNHAIMIRSFLSQNNTLYYQAGAGVVAASSEQNELQEVNNKLAALKKALKLAEEVF